MDPCQGLGAHRLHQFIFLPLMQPGFGKHLLAQGCMQGGVTTLSINGVYMLLIAFTGGSFICTNVLVYLWAACSGITAGTRWERRCAENPRRSHRAQLGSLCASVIFTSSTLVVAVIDGQSDFVFAQSIC